jgi:CheY-like chemotaxis protein
VQTKEFKVSKLILAIEDDKGISGLYDELLTLAGYRVQLMKFKPVDLTLIDQMQPDLIISDWGMGVENSNWDFINAMQSMLRTADIPILVCTAVPMKTNGNEILLNELNIQVLEKPFNIDELLQSVEKHIK